MKQNIPNLLTLLRALAVPAALLLMVTTNAPTLLFWLFVAAAITDFLDGYLARKWHCESAFGAMLDPITDKLLVALMLLYLLLQTHALFVPVALILLRELYVSGLREMLSGRGIALPVSRGGKWKTAVQMLAIAALLCAAAYDVDAAWKIGILALWAAAALALLSAAQYTRAAWPHFR